MSIFRIFPALTLMAFASANLSAQESTRSVRFGVLAGMSLAELTDDFVAADLTSQRRLGVQAAIYLIVPVGNRVALQPELHYVQKGTSYTILNLNDGGDVPAGAEFKLTLGYLEVPLLLRLDLAGASSRLQPFLVGGPSAAYRATCTLGFSSAGFSASNKCDDTMNTPDTDEDPIKKLDYGAVVGGGFALRMLGAPTSIQVRYSRGLTTLAREADVDTGKPKNSVISLLVGVGF